MPASAKKSPAKKTAGKNAGSRPAAAKRTTTTSSLAPKPFGRASTIRDAKIDLGRICASLKTLLKKYEPPFEAVSDYDIRYELQSPKAVSYMGRPPKKIYFAAVILQSSYVGFYFMPVYSSPKMTAAMPPELMKHLKGKACFHIKSDDPAMLRDIKTALDHGLKCYRELGWI